MKHNSGTNAARTCTLAKSIFFLSALLPIFLAVPSTRAQSIFSGTLKSVSITDSLENNTPPIAQFTYLQNGNIFTLDATASSDSDGNIVSYKWVFGDDTGTILTGPSATYILTGKSAQVTLTVVDDQGGTTLTQSVITSSACSSTPVISQTMYSSKSRIGNFSNVYYQGTTYNGSTLDNVCRIDIGLSKTSGNIDTKTFALKVISLDNSYNLTTPKGSVEISGTSIPDSCRMVSFTFDSPISLTSGDAISVNMNGLADSNNYASACISSFNNNFVDGAAATWQENKLLQNLSSGGNDLMLKVYIME